MQYTFEASKKPLFQQSGFTYLGGLFMVAIVALSSAFALREGGIYRQRFDEEMLLAVGLELRSALASYATLSLPNQSSQPSSIKDLLHDPRVGGTVRHLRRWYIDPLTGQTQWGEIRTLDGKGILGFYSLSPKIPIRQGYLPSIFEDFSGKSSYSEWIFSPTPRYALLQNGKRVDKPEQMRPSKFPDSNSNPSVLKNVN